MSKKYIVKKAHVHGRSVAKVGQTIELDETNAAARLKQDLIAEAPKEEKKPDPKGDGKGDGKRDGGNK